MSSVPQKTSLTPYRGVEPDPGYEQIADELAILIAREHATRRRAELAADGLVVLAANLLREIDELREAGEELSVLLAHGKSRQDELEDMVRGALERADAEAAWRRRFKAADRRERRQMLEAAR